MWFTFLGAVVASNHRLPCYFYQRSSSYSWLGLSRVDFHLIRGTKIKKNNENNCYGEHQKPTKLCKFFPHKHQFQEVRLVD
jgi:hypothetical protein